MGPINARCGMQSTSLSNLPMARDHPRLCWCGLSPSLAGVFQSHPATRFELLSHGDLWATRRLTLCMRVPHSSRVSQTPPSLRVHCYSGPRLPGKNNNMAARSGPAGSARRTTKRTIKTRKTMTDLNLWRTRSMRPSLVRRAPTTTPTPLPIPPTGTPRTPHSEITRDHRGQGRTSSSDAQRTPVNSTSAGGAPSAGPPPGVSFSSNDVCDAYDEWIASDSSAATA